MELHKNFNRRERLVRILLTVALAAVAASSFRRGNRLVGVLAGIAAVVLGYTATAGPRKLRAENDIETTAESGEMHCSICGEPIVAGQSRRPGANDQTVHEACMHPRG